MAAYNGLSPSAALATLSRSARPTELEAEQGPTSNPLPLNEAIPKITNIYTQTITLNFNKAHDGSGTFYLPLIKGTQLYT